jgi:hypothetical protein
METNSINEIATRNWEERNTIFYPKSADIIKKYIGLKELFVDIEGNVNMSDNFIREFVPSLHNMTFEEYKKVSSEMNKKLKDETEETIRT